MSAEVALVVPTLGGPHLGTVVEAVVALDPAPARVVVVASGPAADDVRLPSAEVFRVRRRLGFARAVNLGLERAAGAPLVGLLNDDAVPAPGWLEPLVAALRADPRLAAVQGTVTDAGGERVDGRGIALDRFGLPVQVDRGEPAAPEPEVGRPLLAVSGTAALFRAAALARVALAGGGVLDPAFGSYHEDLDLGLRLERAGYGAAFVPGAPVRHRGSATGAGLRWRHPWWVLANRWRALAGNLTAGALAVALPRLLRGELRAVRTLARTNPRAAVAGLAVAVALPVLLVRALARSTPGPRLDALPEVAP